MDPLTFYKRSIPKWQNSQIQSAKLQILPSHYWWRSNDSKFLESQTQPLFDASVDLYRLVESLASNWSKNQSQRAYFQHAMKPVHSVQRHSFRYVANSIVLRKKCYPKLVIVILLWVVYSWFTCKIVQCSSISI